MKMILLLALLIPFTVHAEDACPNLTGTFDNCTTNIQGGTFNFTKMTISQSGNQYTSVETASTGAVSTFTFTADGSVQTQTTSDPTLGQVVTSTQNTCANNSVLSVSTTTANGTLLFTANEVIKLDASNNFVMEVSASDASGSHDLGNVTCVRVQ